jgi:hypothetical protein
MRITLFLFLLALLVTFSCNNLSNNEKEAIQQYHLVVQKNINLRDYETKESIKLIDQHIIADGNKERNLIEFINSTLSELEELKIRYHDNDTLVEKEIVKILTRINSSTKIPLSSRDFPCQDTVIYNSWNSFLKHEITHYIAGKTPYHSDRNIKIYVSPNQKYITQGESYKASFFIGHEKYPKYFGDGLSKINHSTSQLKIIPDQSLKINKWEGYCVLGIDTFKIEIPYEIVTCNK